MIRASHHMSAAAPHRQGDGVPGTPAKRVASASQGWRQAVRRFRHCRSGVAIVEFAFAAPILLMMVVGIMEVSMIFFASTLLEGGLREAARFGITGSQVGASTREEHIVEIINEHGAGLITVAAENISILVYSNFESIGEPEPYADENTNGQYDLGEPFTDTNCNGEWDQDMGRAGAGRGGDVVLYRVEYEWPLLVGMLAPLIGNDGKVPLSASVAVRNEPYSGSTPTC